MTWLHFQGFRAALAEDGTFWLGEVSNPLLLENPDLRDRARSAAAACLAGSVKPCSASPSYSLDWARSLAALYPTEVQILRTLVEEESGGREEII